MTLLSACADNNLGTDRENQSFQNKIRKKIQNLYENELNGKDDNCNWSDI